MFLETLCQLGHIVSKSLAQVLTTGSFLNSGGCHIDMEHLENMLICILLLRMVLPTRLGRPLRRDFRAAISDCVVSFKIVKLPDAAA